MVIELKMSKGMSDRLYNRFKDLEEEIIKIATELSEQASRKMGRDDGKVDSAVFQHILASLYLHTISALTSSYMKVTEALFKYLDTIDGKLPLANARGFVGL